MYLAAFQGTRDSYSLCLETEVWLSLILSVTVLSVKQQLTLGTRPLNRHVTLVVMTL